MLPLVARALTRNSGVIKGLFYVAGWARSSGGPEKAGKFSAAGNFEFISDECLVKKIFMSSP